jgi:hypothetical protein
MAAADRASIGPVDPGIHLIAKPCKALRIDLRNCPLASSGKSVIMNFLAIGQESSMPDTFSDLVEISKLNGDFKRNYGKLIGAFLYLRSISAARGRSSLWSGLFVVVVSAALGWLEKHGFSWLRVGL